MPNEWGRIEFSRGCKFACKFCNFPVIGAKEDYTRDIKNVREQFMDAYDRFGIENYHISDETFNDRPYKISRIADLVETLPWKPYFAGFIRADLLINRKHDREDLLRMGFLGHFYGIETFNPKSASYIGKNGNTTRMKEGLVEVKEYFQKHVGNKYRATISLIAGLPHETLDSLETTYQWVKNHWRDQLAVACPLEIMDWGDSRENRISDDFQKYGYEQIEIDLNPNPNFIFEKDKTVDRTKVMLPGTGKNPPIAWKNPNMDIMQAWDWCNKLDKIWLVGEKNLARTEGYLLSRILCHENGDVLTLEEKLKLVEETAIKHTENFKVFVNNYKTKKLNWK